LPAAGTSAVSVLLASRDAPVGGRRLFPGDSTQAPSRARYLRGRFQYAALGVRDFTIGLSRSTPVSAAPPGGSRFGDQRGRAGAAACRRPLLSGGSGSNARSAGGPEARAEQDVGEEPDRVRPPQGGRTQRQGGGCGARSDGRRGAATRPSSVRTAQDS